MTIYAESFVYCENVLSFCTTIISINIRFPERRLRLIPKYANDRCAFRKRRLKLILNRWLTKFSKCVSLKMEHVFFSFIAFGRWWSFFFPTCESLIFAWKFILVLSQPRRRGKKGANPKPSSAYFMHNVLCMFIAGNDRKHEHSTHARIRAMHIFQDPSHHVHDCFSISFRFLHSILCAIKWKSVWYVILCRPFLFLSATFCVRLKLAKLFTVQSRTIYLGVSI